MVDLKITTVKHDGDLKVCWKDCYQHQDTQTIAFVKQGNMVVVMGEIEFAKFKKVMM